MNFLSTLRLEFAWQASCRLSIVCGVAVLAMLTEQQVVRAQGTTSTVPREHHVWGKFKPGAWNLMRTTTEELDTEGKVSSTSTAETRTSLVAIRDKGVELRVERVIEVAGKRFVKKPVVVHLTLSGAENGQAETVKQLGSEDIELDGKKIACDVRSVEITKADMSRNVKVYYSAKYTPYVFRREIDETAGTGKSYQSISDVTAIDMPHRVLNDIKSTAHSKTVLRNGKSLVTTLSVMTMEVPGGIVMESSKETNLEGKLIRQTTIELVDYGLEPQGETVKLSDKSDGRRRFSRLRSRRESKRNNRDSLRSDRIAAPEPPDAAAPDGPSIAPVSRRESR